MKLNGGSGSDYYSIESTSAGTTLAIQAGTGNDWFYTSPTFQNLDTIAGNVQLAGGGGTNNANFYDGLNAKSVTYTVTSSTVSRTGSASVSYDNHVQGEVLYGSSGSSHYNIESTIAGSPVTVEGGASDDFFHVGLSTGSLANIQAPLTILGLGGSDFLFVHDQHNSKSQPYSVTFANVSRGGAAPITYIVEDVFLYGGSGSDTYNIESTPTGTNIGVQAGNGNDTFNVSPLAHNLNKIQGHLTVAGAGGQNALNIYDNNNASPADYTVTASTVTHSSAADIAYDSITKGLALHGGGCEQPLRHRKHRVIHSSHG